MSFGALRIRTTGRLNLINNAEVESVFFLQKMQATLYTALRTSRRCSSSVSITDINSHITYTHHERLGIMKSSDGTDSSITLHCLEEVYEVALHCSIRLSLTSILLKFILRIRTIEPSS